MDPYNVHSFNNCILSGFFIGTQNEKKPIDNKSFKPEKPDLNFNEILKPITNDDDFGEIGILRYILR